MRNLTKAKCDSVPITAGCVFALGSCSTKSLISFDGEQNISDADFSAGSGQRWVFFFVCFLNCGNGKVGRDRFANCFYYFLGRS